MAQVYEYGQLWDSRIPRAEIKRKIGHIRIPIKMTRERAKLLVVSCNGGEKLPLKQAIDYAMLYYKRKFVKGFKR